MCSDTFENSEDSDLLQNNNNYREHEFGKGGKLLEKSTQRRRILAQCLVTAAVMLSSASCGMPVGYSAILLPQLKISNDSMQINDEMGSWIGTNRPENTCFCKGECIPSGVFNVSACRQNSPSFLSFPHFYAADPYYTDLVRGMQPDRNKHQFYIIIQPKSGIVMEIYARMQVNMLLQPVNHIRLYEKVPKVFIPLFYFTQTVHLRDELAANLRMIQSMPDYANYLMLILCLLGLISICWALCSFFWCRAKHQEKTLKIAKINGNTHQYEEVALSDRLT
nr:unnamed protein product [Callosobruchus chinensis]